MSEKERLVDVMAEIRYRAEEGCSGSHDGTCCDPEMDIHPEDWCNRCLMGVALKALELTEPIPEPR